MADLLIRSQRHAFKGSSDRWCEVCNRPDRHPIHKNEDGTLIQPTERKATQDRKKLEQERVVSTLMEELLWFKGHIDTITACHRDYAPLYAEHFKRADEAIAEAQKVFDRYTKEPKP